MFRTFLWVRMEYLLHIRDIENKFKRFMTGRMESVNNIDVLTRVLAC